MELISFNEKKYYSNCLFFLLTMMLSLPTMNASSLIFVLPLFIVAISTGYINILIYLSTILCISIIQEDLFMFTVILTSSLVSLLLLSFKLIKTDILPIILTCILIPFLYVYHYSYPKIIFLTLMHLLNCLLYKELIPLFIHQNLEILTRKRMVVFMFVVCTMILAFINLNITYTVIMLRYTLLIGIYYLKISSIMPVIVYISICMLFISPGLKDDVLSIMIPLSLYTIYQPIKKYEYISYFLISHIILPFFITYDYVYYASIIIIPAIMFLISPITPFKQDNKDYKEETKLIKLKEKANAFSSLFSRLIEVFEEDMHSINAGEYIGFIYDDVCNHCRNKDQCFYQSSGMNTLSKMMIKGINQGLDEQDKHYIHHQCIKANEYINSIEHHRLGYIKMMKINQSHHHLKKDLCHEFSMMSCIFDKFFEVKKGINDKQIIDYLNAYQFDIYYLKKVRHDYQSYSLEMGIKNTNETEIKEDLIPILQSYLKENLELVSIKKSIGYLSIILQHDILYSIQVSSKQIALDDYCGDNYISFPYKGHQYVCLSDGMGQGYIAHKESKLTLDLLSQFIKNDISLKDTLNTLNSLFKIKNQGDMYTTLDLFDFNLMEMKLKIIKYGACCSYLITKQRIDIIDHHSLPIGMSRKMATYNLDVQVDDLFIMTSDGISDEFEKILEKYRMKLLDMTEHKIAQFLYEKTKIDKKRDDMTLIVMKVVKKV